jgi:hypothetical protein
VSKVLIQNWQKDDKNCAMTFGRLTYIAIRHARAQFLMLSFSSFVAMKIRMAAGGHLDLDNDHIGVVYLELMAIAS